MKSERVLILGATSAIAQAVARLFAAQGAALGLVARNAQHLEAVKQDVAARGASQVHTYCLDISDCKQHQTLLENATHDLGGLDIALIAFGTLGDQKKCEQSFEVAEKELHNNFISVASLLTLLANRFEIAQAGSIAVITSVAGDRGRQSNYVYGSVKGGLSIFLQGLRNRLYRSGVQVLNVKPGFVDTPMTAHLKKGPLFVGPEVVARGIVRAIRKGSDTVYLPWFWQIIMLIICYIPERVFKRLRL